MSACSLIYTSGMHGHQQGTQLPQQPQNLPSSSMWPAGLTAGKFGEFLEWRSMPTEMQIKVKGWYTKMKAKCTKACSLKIMEKCGYVWEIYLVRHHDCYFRLFGVAILYIWGQLLFDACMCTLTGSSNSRLRYQWAIQIGLRLRSYFMLLGRHSTSLQLTTCNDW